MQQRSQRVAELVRQTAGHGLQKLLPQLQLTITRVIISPDLRYGDVWVSQLKGAHQPGEIIEEINERSPELQAALGKSLKTKFTPKLRWHLDSGSEHTDHIEKLLKSLE